MRHFYSPFLSLLPISAGSCLLHLACLHVLSSEFSRIIFGVTRCLYLLQSQNLDLFVSKILFQTQCATKLHGFWFVIDCPIRYSKNDHSDISVLDDQLLSLSHLYKHLFPTVLQPHETLLPAFPNTLLHESIVHLHFPMKV